MITHNLKIRKEFADAILRGDKPFEVRENDRGFQRGDYVRFTAIDKYATEIPYHPINEKDYKITYVLSGWGIGPGTVVFAIKEMTHDA